MLHEARTTELREELAQLRAEGVTPGRTTASATQRGASAEGERRWTEVQLEQLADETETVRALQNRECGPRFDAGAWPAGRRRGRDL